jgi:hypothetical protein
VRRLAPLLSALVLAGCGGDDAPPRALEPVRLAAPPLADAFAKQATEASLAGGDLGALLDRLGEPGDFEVRRDEITQAGVTARDIRIRKLGDRFAAEGTVDPEELERYAPGGLDLEYDPDAGGPGVVLSGTRSVLGANIDVTVRIVPDEGAVVAEPEGIPVGSATLFSDPRVRIDGLAARPLGGGLVRGRVVGEIVG